MEERLQKIMAQAGLASRRESEKLIAAGQVRVNGRVAKLGDKADPAVDRIEIRGRVLKPRDQEAVYIALNKPKGIISSLADELEAGRTTVRDLIPIQGHLYPVGRLDKQSEGLILMTNDGDLAHKLTHPRYGHEKTYRVVVEGRTTPEGLEAWWQGIFLDGRKTAPAKVTLVRQEKTFTQLEIVMREGRKRQIRRVASILGYTVQQLVREKIGTLNLGNLKSGEWRYLHENEIAALRQSVQASWPASRKPRPHQGDGRQASQKRKRN